MLKNIPGSFTPDLLKLMMEMGHGESLLIADGNFPQKSMDCETSIYIPATNISELLADILEFFPLDYAVEAAAFAMESVTEGGERYGEYTKLVQAHGSKLELVGRFAFYDIAKQAVGIIITADTTKGGNILIKKGVVKL